MRNLYNRESHAVNESKKPVDQKSTLKAIALAELVAFIEESRNDPDTCPVFALSDLVKMYTERLTKMGVTLDCKV